MRHATERQAEGEEWWEEEDSKGGGGRSDGNGHNNDADAPMLKKTTISQKIFPLEE
jgi:hypothetical protein